MEIFIFFLNKFYYYYLFDLIHYFISDSIFNNPYSFIILF